MPDEETTYPWLRLLELELGEERRPPRRRSPGRPRKAFPRKRVRTSLTQDELTALDDLVEALSEKMERPIHRGHVIAFMTFRLRNQLLRGQEIAIPEDVDSFVGLARYLDSRSR